MDYSDIHILRLEEDEKVEAFDCGDEDLTALLPWAMKTRMILQGFCISTWLHYNFWQQKSVLV